MWKVLAIAILLTVGLPVHGEKKSGESDSNKEQSEAAKNPSPPSWIAICAVKQDGSGIECKGSQTHPQTYFDRLIAAEDVPNLLLFFVGLGAIWAALMTLRVVKRQTALMEVPYRQWVSVENWNVSYDASVPHSEVLVKFKIVNPTPFPIEIKSGRFEFGEPMRARFELGEPTFLTPHTPYEVPVGVWVTKEDLTHFNDDLLWLSVKGSVVHKGVLGDKHTVTQNFEVVLLSNQTGTQVLVEVPMIPKAEDSQRQGQNPN